MVISDHLRPAPACCPVCVDQRLRIDFEMGRGLRVDIGGRLDGGDAHSLPQNEAAAFMGVSAGGLVDHLLEMRACDLNEHCPMPVA